MPRRIRKVLLAEDNRVQLLASRFALQRLGYQVELAMDGEHALRAARRTFPDLIILDLLLPKLPGNEVLRALKQDPLTSDIPVVVVSVLSQLNEHRLADEGAAAYHEKCNLSPEMLGGIVRAIIGGPTVADWEGLDGPGPAAATETNA